MNYTKYIKDGKVAVLYSPGYGAGWSTWMPTCDLLNAALFDSRIVERVLVGAPVTEDFLKSIWGDDKHFEDAYLGGADNLAVTWLPVGTQFLVTEYDGSESIEINTEINWSIA